MNARWGLRLRLQRVRLPTRRNGCNDYFPKRCRYPHDKQIRSWSFYSRGGFVEATCTKNGNSWAVRTTARTADGKKVSAMNLLMKTDNDEMTWRMTRLTVDGESLSGAKPVNLNLIKPTQS